MYTFMWSKTLCAGGNHDAQMKSILFDVGTTCSVSDCILFKLRSS